ncbi:PAS domain-containing protein [Actibacterium ureilyticum]|uniref:PAS domain-containing protein n=1 Tax=Actibacterium ureilyticum TaxID=1590614 RepID=UPI001595F536|nr:PAS domain-containing protein [Actibacterium ureilyticum]
MRFALNNEVEAYWEGLRDGRPMPARSEIDPRGIDRALGHTFILEKVAPGMARFRLAGQHLNRLMGMDVRGMPVSALLGAESRPEFALHLKDLFDGKTTLRIALHAKGGLGRPALGAEMILLPLNDPATGIDRALGCLVSDGQLGTAPRRFTITDIRTRGLIQPVQQIPAFVEDPAPFAPRPAPPARRPKLRLVSDRTDAPHPS